MIRQTISDAYKTAMRERDQAGVSALRLIMAKLKDKDIEARPSGRDQISDEEILQMLQGMIKQRRESVEMYRNGARADLAAVEEAEIVVIERFLPRQLDDAATAAAVAAAIAAVGAVSPKDMGKVMAELKAKHAGVMDFQKASAAVKAQLSV